MGDKSFSDYMLERFSNGITKSVFLFGEGGSGKTTSMMSLYSNLMENRTLLNLDNGVNKRIVPLYMPLFQVIGDIDDDYITEYMWRKATGQLIDDVTAKRVCDDIFNSQDCEYHFVLMLDGINETMKASNLQLEIKRLAGYINITICLTARVEKDAGPFSDNMDIISLSRLTEEVVLKKVKKYVEALDKEEIDILSNQFYLTRWIEMSEDPDEDVKVKFNKGILIQYYFKWLVKRYKRNQSAEYVTINDRELDFTQALDLSLEYLSELASYMNRNKTMVLDIERIRQDKEAELGFIQRNNERIELGTDIMDQFFVPLGILKKTDGECYFFRHQIYKDYYTAMDIINIYKDDERKASIYDNCPKEVLDIIFNICFNLKSFLTAEKSFAIPAKDFYHELRIDFDDPDSFCYKNLTVYCYIVFNAVDSINYGSIDKEKVCKSVLPMTQQVADYAIANEEKVFTDMEDELIREHAEVLRRGGGRYEEALRYGEKELVLCKKHNLETYKAENGVGKILLYMAFNQAKNKKGQFDEEIYAKYHEAVQMLGKIKTLYTPTANLYSMLLAYPDPYSSQYLDRIWSGQTADDRKLEAANLCWKTIYENIIGRKHNSQNMKNYTVVQLVRLLLLRTISVKYNGECRSQGSFEDFICRNVDNLEFVTYDSSHSQVTDELTVYIMEYLWKKLGNVEFANSSLARLFFLLQKPDDLVKECIERSPGDYHSRFLRALLYDGGNMDEVDKILLFLDKKQSEDIPQPDVYTFEYRANDIRQLWESAGRSARQYTKEFTNTIDERFSKWSEKG